MVYDSLWNYLYDSGGRDGLLQNYLAVINTVIQTLLETEITVTITYHSWDGWFFTFTGLLALEKHSFTLIRESIKYKRCRYWPTVSNTRKIWEQEGVTSPRAKADVSSLMVPLVVEPSAPRLVYNFLLKGLN